MKQKYFKDAISIIHSFFWKMVNMRVKTNGLIMLSPKCELSFSKYAKVIIGSRVSVERGTLLAAREHADLSLGNGVYINRNCMIVAHNKIAIDSGVTIGPNCCIYDHDHDITSRGQFNVAPITIGKNAWIGAGVIILKGVSIGEGAVISAGSVVVKDVPDYTVLVQKRNNSYIEYTH